MVFLENSYTDKSVEKNTFVKLVTHGNSPRVWNIEKPSNMSHHQTFISFYWFHNEFN